MRHLLLSAMIFAVTLTAAEVNPNGAKDVLAAMESLKTAMIAKDGAALQKLLSDDLTYTHSTGQEETKAQFIKAIASGKSIVERLDYMGTTVRTYGNTALVKGKVDLYHSSTNIVHMNILHVWAKGPDGWKLVARQATRLTAK
jgi:ketosteroid isomerase-like protein